MRTQSLSQNCLNDPAPNPVFGAPNIERASTSYEKRSSLTVRMTNRRFTRLANSFRKKQKKSRPHAGSLFHVMQLLPDAIDLEIHIGIAAGIADHQWSLDEVVAMIDACHEAKDAAAFEAAFEAKWTRPRTFPETYTPTPKDRLPVPWYLDVNSGGEPGEAKSP